MKKLIYIITQINSTQYLAKYEINNHIVIGYISASEINNQNIQQPQQPTPQQPKELEFIDSNIKIPQKILLTFDIRKYFEILYLKLLALNKKLIIKFEKICAFGRLEYDYCYLNI